ncbi:alternate F1F0 ATPase, F1 subunit alpha [Hyphococcus luteus]|uniref:ATP synthase subunit alpha n=1 Tax=Hyphococcus luteus TaxID=2058213 RepID=A0A2S7KAV2_9PROT|nr:alternate F1F0 ATPase, F1 subunit alpha [Marinicaulis flavus]PQA89569.1 F0F1 ATP synthase subunit alpha [Marinicaulis flavus]
MTGSETLSLRASCDNVFDELSKARRETPPRLSLMEEGAVAQVGEGVAFVTGFSELLADELLSFPGGLMGIASTIRTTGVGVVLLGGGDKLHTGAEVRRTKRVVDAPVGEGLLGRVVDGLGRPLDGGGPVKAAERWPIERPAPAIMDRAPVAEPLQTGLKSVDAAIPIGRGQRELILGDRQTGKTAVAVSAILNQKNEDVVCIYCAIGQRASAVARVIDQLEKGGMRQRTIVVAASGEEAPGLQFVAPYAATSMAEYFMEKGRDVLIVYDDLTRHARAYRELSLLLRRPPGREAYPGDIFYIHSRLLERAAHLSKERGGGSLTALPVIETQAQNISAYIPTNLISITDGQIYLSPDLFSKGVLPAVDIGLSVSRVGGDAQRRAYRAVAPDLRLYYAQFEELESFSRFGARLDKDTRQRLERGRRIREVLKQGEYDRFSAPEQIAVLLSATEGVFDDVAIEDIDAAEAAIRRAANEDLPDLSKKILSDSEFGEEDKKKVLAAARSALERKGVDNREDDS